jgi:hypothetical protein
VSHFYFGLLDYGKALAANPEAGGSIFSGRAIHESFSSRAHIGGAAQEWFRQIAFPETDHYGPIPDSQKRRNCHDDGLEPIS